MMDDKELLQKYVQHNDEDAFREIVERHRDMIYSSALRQTRNEDVAEDVTQAVFIMLAQKACGIRKGNALSGWLFQSARYACKAALRSLSRRRRHEKNAAEEKEAQRKNAGKNCVSWDELAPHLDSILSQMKTSDRDAILLRFFENNDYKTIGRQLGISESAATMRVNRALERARKLFVRRGITVSIIVLGALLGANSVHAAPATLTTAAIASIAVSKSIAASGFTELITKGAIKMMFWTKIKVTAFCICFSILAAGAAGKGIVTAADALDAMRGKEKAEEKTDEEKKAEQYTKLSKVGLKEAEEVYNEFNEFCKQHFGAEKEPLTYEKFGNNLKFTKSGEWNRFSMSSACITFETNLPALTHVEYGESNTLDEKTNVHERHFYLHTHYLKNLKENTKYFYKLVAVDERGNKIESDVRNFSTTTPKDVIRIEGGNWKEPYIITKPGNYVLISDVVADKSGIIIKSPKVTLDLNAHTIIYDNVRMKQIEGDFWKFFYQSSIGIKIEKRNLKDINIYNGTIKQGAGNDAANNQGAGFSALDYISGCSGELSGITAEYHGNQVCGVRIKSENIHAHHNTVTDKGYEIQNRHQGCKAMSSVSNTHHNLIKRGRHGCLSGGSDRKIYNNEIYGESCATNASGIGFYKGKNSKVYDNKVFGTGYLFLGIATLSSGGINIEIYNNFIHLQADKPSKRWAEYGSQSGAYCTRITWGGKNYHYHDNYMIAYGKDKGMVRGVWHCPSKEHENIVFENNIIKAMVQNDQSDVQGGICITGNSGKPAIFRNNRVISNFCNVRLGEDFYGPGDACIFEGNTFVRSGNLKRYRTINIGHGSKALQGFAFIDSKFENGAGYDKVKWVNTDKHDHNFTIAWTTTVKTTPNAKVVIKDAKGEIAFEGVADAKGLVSVPLRQKIVHSNKAEDYTPHVITVSIDGKTENATVTVDKTKEVNIIIN